MRILSVKSRRRVLAVLSFYIFLALPDSAAAQSDDLPTVSVSGGSATEGASVAFTLSMSGSEQTVTVQYATSSGTAMSGIDFTETSGTLHFLPRPEGDNVTVTVQTTADTVAEEDETFTLTLSNPTNATLGASATATGTINEPDQESPPVASVSGGNSATEGNDVEFTITLSKASESTVSVAYSPVRESGDTATRGDDFTWIGGSAYFFPGATSSTLWVSTTDDAIEEESETFTVRLTSATNAVLGTRTAGGTILDNDSPPTVSLSNASATEGDAVSFTVSLSAESGKEVTVLYATSSETATSGTDFTAASGTLTFPAGSDSQTVNVSTTEDTDTEGDETFTLTLSSPTNATLGTRASATGTINDDDAPGAPTLNVSGGSADEGNAVNFTVSLSVESEDEVTVQYATSSGTATSDTDFTATSGTLTLTAGTDSQTVSVSTANDSTDEENETFTLTLSSPTNATLGDDRASGTIRDNDDPPTVSVADANAAEGADVVFTVSLSPASGKRVTVEYETLSVSATSDTDFTAASGTLAFEAGTTSQTVSVSTASDSTTERNEVFAFRLSSPTNAILAVNDSTATGTIVDVSEPAPDLAVGLPRTNDGNLVGGTEFNLLATVENRGTGASSATTLRFYRSRDATITASDTEEAAVAVAGLPASLNYVGSADLTAPTTPGTYYYGACVDTVASESDTTNNCSSSVEVSVQQPQPQQTGRTWWWTRHR